jgi:hypothetical protein
MSWSTAGWDRTASAIRLLGEALGIPERAEAIARYVEETRAIGPPEEVVSAEMLSAVYHTEVLVEQTPSGRRVCVPAWERSARGGLARAAA